MDTLYIQFSQNPILQFFFVLYDLLSSNTGNTLSTRKKLLANRQQRAILRSAFCRSITSIERTCVECTSVRVHVRQRDDRNLSIHVCRYNMRIGSDIKNDEWWLAEGYTPLDHVFLPCSLLVILCLFLYHFRSSVFSPLLHPGIFVLRILMLARNLSPLTRRKENV